MWNVYEGLVKVIDKIGRAENTANMNSEEKGDGPLWIIDHQRDTGGGGVGRDSQTQ